MNLAQQTVESIRMEDKNVKINKISQSCLSKIFPLSNLYSDLKYNVDISFSSKHFSLIWKHFEKHFCFHYSLYLQGRYWKLSPSPKHTIMQLSNVPFQHSLVMSGLWCVYWSQFLIILQKMSVQSFSKILPLSIL